MADDEIGYGKPPKKTQFKPGVSGNAKGRPKRKLTAVSDVIKNTLSAPIQYRDQGRSRTITRTELGLKKLVENAVKGDLSAAGTLLRYRELVACHGDVGVETIEVTNWWEDYAGQTAEQKSQESAIGKRIDTPE